MDTFRHVVATLIFVTVPAGFLFWIVIHPLARFWRRRPPFWAYGAAIATMAASMAGLYLVRGRFVRVDFGGSGYLLFLGILCLTLASVLGLHRKRHLTGRILAGWPELASGAGPGQLLTDGIYAQIRHPRYVEALIGVLGWSFVADHLASYVIALVSVPMIRLIVWLEERELSDRFGERYAAYSATVPRFLPGADAWWGHPRALGRAWLLLTAALAGHVIDEAENEFLAVYNPIASAIRDRAPLIPIPTFEFDTWIAGLTIAVAALSGLSIVAFRRTGWIRRFALVYAILMIGNGLLHITGSLVLARAVPGIVSSPVLILAAGNLLLASSGRFYFR